MPRYYFDIETDGLLNELTKIHSLVLIDVDTGGLSVSAHEGPTIAAGLRMLAEAEEIIGHNIINFDIPAIQKVMPQFQPTGKVTDTLVLSRLLFGDMYDADTKRKLALARRGMPPKLIGSHGLKAWGYRLGILKGTFGEDTDWSEWSPQMQEYCEQDVRVTEALYKHLLAQNPAPMSVELEHRFADVIAKQVRFGFSFDEVGAARLYAELVGIRASIAKELQEAFPPKTLTTWFTPKVNNSTRGYVKGVPTKVEKVVEFNPSSRQMIAARLQELGWEPQEFTPSGQPKVDETVLNSLPYPQAKVLARHFLVEKRIGQIAEGDQAWLKLVRNGRIHGDVNTNGAVTGRCTHARPNVGQVPSVQSDKSGVKYGEAGGWGAECRALFRATPGRMQVGVDLSGLELRCLAHYMARYDGGAYGRVLLEGDVHTVNQEAAGLPTRAAAKTFIYAFLYGAGDQKIGSIVLPEGCAADQKAAGAKLKRSFLRKTPALARLKEDISKRVKDRRYLTGLDGRKLTVRSEHAALNTLLQSAGALISKMATVLAYDRLREQGLEWGKDFAFVAHVHDEIQADVRMGVEEVVGKTIVAAMEETTTVFNLKCPITGEYKIGLNWKETH